MYAQRQTYSVYVVGSLINCLPDFCEAFVSVLYLLSASWANIRFDSPFTLYIISRLCSEYYETINTNIINLFIK